MSNTISDIYINLNNVLDHCNEAFAVVDIEPANTIYEIEDRLKLVEIDDTLINSIIEGSIVELSHKKISRVDVNMFADCTSLTSVNLPECSYVAFNAFNNCTSLTSIDLPMCSYVGGDYSIGGAFYNCTSLTSINLPMCSYVGSNAFYNCTSLTSVTLGYQSVVKLAYSNAFSSTPISNSTYTGSFGSIYVPASLVDSYKVANNWSYYANRIIAMEVDN